MGVQVEGVLGAECTYELTGCAPCISVAPMMEWTDRHCRYFLRLITPQARLYTEMITTGALCFGDVKRHLQYHPSEHPLAIQLGGNSPQDLAYAAQLAQQWGYDEINLNCGCPSPRVQRGAFGAGLMKEPNLVADCVQAMGEAVAWKVPITVKHRIGVDEDEDYDFVAHFVHTVGAAGCQDFIVHARSAWLQGLSPKENREIPPLRYEVVPRLQNDFPQYRFTLNGGITRVDEVQTLYQQGISRFMIGRAAYHQPWLLRQLQETQYITNTAVGRTCEPHPNKDMAEDSQLEQRLAVMQAMKSYVVEEMARDSTLPASAILRHTLGLFHGLRGARGFRQVLSTADNLHQAKTGQQAVALLDKALAEIAS